MVKLSNICSIAFGVAALAASSLASAGEVTGTGKYTPVNSYTANSICAFSGLEDGYALALDEFGNPILDEFGDLTFIQVAVGHGLVQTPNHETSPGYYHAPGIPGDACRGNL